MWRQSMDWYDQMWTIICKKYTATTIWKSKDWKPVYSKMRQPIEEYWINWKIDLYPAQWLGRYNKLN